MTDRSGRKTVNVHTTPFREYDMEGPAVTLHMAGFRERELPPREPFETLAATSPSYLPIAHSVAQGVGRGCR
jgi:hypothetical protein